VWEYVVGGVIATGGTAFALFNAWVSERDDRVRKAEERTTRLEADHHHEPSAAA